MNNDNKPVMTVEQFQALDAYIHAVIDYHNTTLHQDMQGDYSDVLQTGRHARSLLTGEPPPKPLDPQEAEELSETKRYVNEARRQVKENSERAAKLPQPDPRLPRISSYAADNPEVHREES